MRTPELLDRLKRHYLKPGATLPGGIFLPEVGWNGGGLGAGGCDAIYVGFTSTSGRILVGHELKISRADWLNELNKPGKSDPWADQCHEWWLVVSDPAIVHDGELPAGWGLMVPGTSKTRMRIVHKPDRKPATHNPSWLAARSIMARQDTLRAQALADERTKAWEKAREQIGPQVEAEVGRRLKYQPTIDDLQHKLDLVEDALGARIDYADSSWRRLDQIGLDDVRAMAAAVRAHGNVARAVEQLTNGYLNPVRHTRTALDELAGALADLGRAAQPQPEGIV